MVAVAGLGVTETDVTVGPDGRTGVGVPVDPPPPQAAGSMLSPLAVKNAAFQPMLLMPKLP
jgi:hypothetical protein